MEIELLPPCGLHLILAHHRYLWEFLQSVIIRRNQQNLIPVAFKRIDCSYLSLQYRSFLESKKKHFDGNQKLKMIGDDCKKMEVQIDKFLSVFILEGDTIESKSCEYLKHVLRLYKMFQDIALEGYQHFRRESRDFFYFLEMYHEMSMCNVNHISIFLGTIYIFL